MDKDPNYVPFINVETTTIDPLCTADGMHTFSKLIEITIDDSNKFPFIVIVETNNNTGHMNQEITLRKRRMTKNEKYTRQAKIKETQNKKQIDKHPIILKTCDGICKKQCPLLSNEHQKEIWLHYWKLNYSDRRKYLSKCVTLGPIKQRRVSTNDDTSLKKNKSFLFIDPS